MNFSPCGIKNTSALPEEKLPQMPGFSYRVWFCYGIIGREVLEWDEPHDLGRAAT